LRRAIRVVGGVRIAAERPFTRWSRVGLRREMTRAKTFP
jgi:hypothetical protein